jgi:hypothetical protein
MTVESPVAQPEPASFNSEKEMRQQTELLKSINGKLTFFVVILVITIIFQLLGAFMSL